VQTINLRDVFEGRLPRTADASHDPQDLISPRGDFSLDGSFPGCTSLPAPQNLPADMVGQVRRAHTGQSPLLNAQCVGRNYGQATVARGYATIDVVKDCTALRPGDAGYFGPSGVAASDNVLWGDFFYVDPDGRFAQGDGLVRIEADPERFGPGDLTFYGRYVNGSGADGRGQIHLEVRQQQRGRGAAVHRAGGGPQRQRRGQQNKDEGQKESFHAPHFGGLRVS